ncbi:MAG TPA: hypothetical protein VFO62_05935 [Candidatus Binatia bacterium]|nr:hypothetical protein [Candidatus Binatia bacterium]
MSPNAAPNELKYPDEMLALVKISQRAKDLAADLQHESRTDRIYAIIELAFKRSAMICGVCWASAWVPVPPGYESEYGEVVVNDGSDLGHDGAGLTVRCDHCWLIGLHRKSLEGR